MTSGIFPGLWTPTPKVSYFTLFLIKDPMSPRSFPGKQDMYFDHLSKSKSYKEVMLPPPPPHPLPLVLYWQFRNCARDLGIARLTMHRGTVLGDGSFVHVPPNSPMMQLFIWASMFSQGPQRERWPLISGGPIACWTFHGQDLTERCTETSSFYQIAKT